MPAAWPTSPPSYPFEEEVHLAQIKSRFEDGKVQSRVKWTSARDRFSLRWIQMEESEYQDFKLHFEANQGSTFSWTHPITSTVYTVRYMSDSLKTTATLPGYRSVRVQIEEA